MTIVSLIADVGATNARFALLGTTGEIERVRVLACADYPSIGDAIEAYLGQEQALTPSATQRPRAAALAAISRPSARFKRRVPARRCSPRATTRTASMKWYVACCGFTSFSPMAGGGSAVAAAPIGVVGPGSGLGVGGLIPMGDRWFALSAEGGHITMAPATARESIVLDHMRRRFDHVSAERLLSGPGLVNLYNTLAQIDSVPAASYSPAQIADPQIGEQEPHCREAVEMFCSMLGTIASNLALTLGARGGVYIAGGIVPKLGPRFAASTFRDRFEDKGRMRPFLTAIPTYVIIHPFPAFLGLAALLSEKTIVAEAACAVSMRS